MTRSSKGAARIREDAEKSHEVMQLLARTMMNHLPMPQPDIAISALLMLLIKMHQATLIAYKDEREDALAFHEACIASLRHTQQRLEVHYYDIVS